MKSKRIISYSKFVLLISDKMSAENILDSGREVEFKDPRDGKVYEAIEVETEKASYLVLLKNRISSNQENFNLNQFLKDQGENLDLLL